MRQAVAGKPDPEHVSTSFAERQNLSTRMGTRRLTLLTKPFSKKAENHAHAMSTYFMHYNFGASTRRCAARPRWPRA